MFIASAPEVEICWKQMGKRDFCRMFKELAES